ncbi:hypothetical protein [Yersinia enterocolitica]|uniref:Uncharacterized protein n=2 Tax=Yersinia enterocolitica TaxID=630 RepID=A0ABM9SJX1_YEREN|nr:hypothetical protein [Yersinia enterocolitica]EKN3396434.1 hypothetical protein [Yersinia enterocolitica]CFV40429.1 Uncharacterised protein [Yersinia enterocolitica]CNE80652.1 Uncharacterised protein [Yersinia enterocolitica]CNF70494.1 Uncharacterised protein [Yersinia enterocolitica]CNG64093.1 Uncharacterised protein [Yersinia enterocolitica]
MKSSYQSLTGVYAADYSKYRALSAQHERGTLARKCCIKQSWLSRKYLRECIH